MSAKKGFHKKGDTANPNPRGGGGGRAPSALKP